MKKLIVFLVALLIYFKSDATNYYVDFLNGNDANTGTVTTPWRTVAKVSSFSFSAGDFIFFKRGYRYPGTILVHNSGSSSLPITFSAYGVGENPIFDNTIPISNFAEIGTSNIWRMTAGNASLGTTVNMLFKDGVSQQLGRYPNVDVGYLFYESHSGNTSITDNSSLSNNWVGGYAAVRTEKFFRDGAKITAQSGGTLTFSGGLYATPTDNYGYFITRDSSTLDQEGEFYYDPSTKKLSFYTTLSSVGTITVPTKDTLVKANNVSYITFEYLDFYAANLTAFSIVGGQNFIIRNCNITYSGDFGIINNSCDNMRVENCLIDNSLSSGIRASNVFGCYFGHNIISNSGVRPGMNTSVATIGDGIEFRGYNSTFEYNRVNHVGYAGLHFNTMPEASGGGSNILCQNNLIDGFCEVSNDGGGIYAYNGVNFANTINNRIYNNIVMNGIGGRGTLYGLPSGETRAADCIYLDNGSRGFIVKNNTSYNGSRGIYLHFTINTVVSNNSTYNCDYGFFAQSRAADPLRNDIVTNNIFFAKQSTQYTGWFETLDGDDVALMFTKLDTNYYVRPIAENTSTLMRDDATNVSFTTWRLNHAAYDVHSGISPKTIVDLNDLRFEYNDTESNKTISLPFNYIDGKGMEYDGSITLAPFTSAVLIKNGASTIPSGTNSSKVRHNNIIQL